MEKEPEPGGFGQLVGPVSGFPLPQVSQEWDWGVGKERKRGKGERGKGEQNRRGGGKEKQERRRRRKGGRKKKRKKGKGKEKKKEEGKGQRKALESPAAHPLALHGASRCLPAPAFPERDWRSRPCTLNPRRAPCRLLARAWPAPRGWKSPWTGSRGKGRRRKRSSPHVNIPRASLKAGRGGNAPSSASRKERAPRAARCASARNPPARRGSSPCGGFWNPPRAWKNPGRMDTIRGVPWGYC